VRETAVLGSTIFSTADPAERTIRRWLLSQDDSSEPDSGSDVLGVSAADIEAGIT
jgi:hypothetical protein